MRRNWTPSFNRIALVLGLLGIALQVGISAWHPARAGSHQLPSQLLADLQSAICHGDGLAGPAQLPEGGSGDDSKDPSNPGCLICKNLAGSSLAILARPAVQPNLRTASRWLAPIDFGAVAGAPLLAPRNRGPPSRLS
jgi:hypothetical protein